MLAILINRFPTYLSIIISSEMADPFQSVRNKINLPHTHNVKNDFKLFPPLRKDQEDNLQQLSEPLLAKTNELVKQLNESFYVYDNPAHHVFKFPPSLFPDVPPGQRNMITYEQKMIVEQENTFKNRLAEDQIEEIAEKGEFKVKSNIEYVTIPYVWKINETLFWGRQKVDLVWKNSLAKIYGMFVEAKDRLFRYVPSELQKIAKIPKLLFSIIFGERSLRVVVSVDYQHEIFKDFWKKIMNEHYKESEEWGSALWKFMYVHYDPQLDREPEHIDDQHQMAKRREKKRVEREEQVGRKLLMDQKQDKIRAVDAKFNQQWGKLRKKVIVQVSQEINGLNNSLENKAGSQEDLLVNAQSNNDEKILDVLAEKKFSLYIEHMKRQLPKENIPLNVINAIVIMLRLFKVINSKYDQKTKTIQKKKKEIEDKIRKNHPIKSLYPPFFTRHVDAEASAISSALNEQMYQSLLKDKDFSSLLNEQQKYAYKQYIKLRSNYSILESAKKNQLRQLHEPSRIFYSNHMLLPPYKIIHQNGYYSLKKVSDDLTVDTNTNFWKFKLYWMRLKTWSINCLIFLIYVVWKGPTGLRCLFGRQDFGYEMEINYQTGHIYYNQRRTVIGQFLKVLQGMNESRHRFQAQPDLGLLGKNVSRIFNYAECYLFRFLFVGVLLVLIGYPILIVFCSVVSTILVVTVWAWIPLILLVTYTFNIFIYQFESSLIPDRRIVRSIPIISIVYKIVKMIIVTVLLTLNLVLWVPLKSLFVFIFCLTQRVFRTAVDKLFVLLFRKVGRTPSRDTSIARKISGPGMSKEFYMSINEEDVYVIIQARLEQIFMMKFNDLMHQEIQKNLNKSNQIMRLVLKPFNASNNGLNYINENTYKLNQNYSVQYNNYMARYPGNPNRVRFTQEEIDAYFDNTVNIVKNFVVRHQIEKWIFEQYVLYEDMYDELTRAIWIQVFGCGEEIFQPLEKLDARFKLEDQYNNEDGFNYSMKRNVRQVMKSLEGEVALNHHRQKLTPFKHNLLHRQQRVEGIESVFSYLNSNSYLNIHLDLQRLQSLFVPNLNINDIVTIQSERRERQIRAYPNIVDL